MNSTFEDTAIEPDDAERTPPRTDGLAIASLIGGLLGLFCILPVIGSVVGVVGGHLARRRIARTPGVTGGGLALAGIVTGYVGLVISGFLTGAVVMPLAKDARLRARRAASMAAMKLVATGAMQYTTDNMGWLPPDLGTLVDSHYVQPGETWIVPGSATPVPRSGADIRAGQTDYVYVGKGLKDDNGEAYRLIFAYSEPGALGGDWVNLMFLDFHVEGTAAPDGVAALADERGWILPAGKQSP